MIFTLRYTLSSVPPSNEDEETFGPADMAAIKKQVADLATRVTVASVVDEHGTTIARKAADDTGLRAVDGTVGWES